MPSPLFTDISTLLLAITAKLVSDGLFDSSACWLGIQDTVSLPDVADQYCIVTLGDQEVDQDIVIGAGTSVTYIEAIVHATLWSRLALDAGLRSDAYLTDVTKGILPKFKCILNSLQMFQPLDGSANMYIAEPMRLDEYDPIVQVKPELPGWGYLGSKWILPYVATLSCP